MRLLRTRCELLLGVSQAVHRPAYHRAILLKQLQAAKLSTPKTQQANLIPWAVRARQCGHVAVRAKQFDKARQGTTIHTKTKSTIAAAPNSAS